MDIKGLFCKLKNAAYKYKYAIIILLIGIALLLIPQNAKEQPVIDSVQKGNSQTFEADELSAILQTVQGAGRVKVLLSVASGENTIYQVDVDVSSDSDNATSKKQETVIVTDSQRAEAGLINRIDPPTYLGAIVVCDGADSATVRLGITQAVA